MTVVSHTVKETVLKYGVYLHSLIDSKECYHNLLMVYVFKSLEELKLSSENYSIISIF